MRKSDQCLDYPYCGCGRKWKHWSEFDVGEWDRWSPDDVENARASMEFMLTCVSCHCPDPAKRAHAQLQLMHPIWRRRYAF